MRSVLVTGFPGFLASQLIPVLLKRHGSATRIDCIVEERFIAEAGRRRASIPTESRTRVHIHAGDITKANLGLDSTATGRIRSHCVSIYHFAAVYDLGVRKELAYAVNVDGTRNVLEFAAGATSLEHLHHVSTCYVSGDHRGLFTEEDLDVGQGFRNYYEETKYLSEILVHQTDLPDCSKVVYRPSIVAGDSRTGATTKFDGLYFFIQWMMWQPRVASVWPRVADPREHTLNVVPADFVVGAIAELSALPRTDTIVYQLCNPRPPTIATLIDLLSESTGRRVLEVPLPLSLARLAIRAISAVHPRVDIPEQAVEYLAHKAQYDASNMIRDLSGAGMEVPDVSEYLPRMVDFFRASTER